MDMKSQLYLYHQLREKYIRELEIINKFFTERLLPVFSNAEIEAENYEKTLRSQLDEVVKSGFEEIDADSLDELVKTEALEYYEMISLMNYRTIGMWITCLCQVWEQQLYSFIIRSGKQEGINYGQDNSFDFCKRVFFEHQQDLEKMESWKKIQELRLLVNVLKHSEGKSERKLRDIRPDYFQQNIDGKIYDIMSFSHSSLREQALMIKDEDFKNYFDALVQFWTDIPERMYTAYDI